MATYQIDYFELPVTSATESSAFFTEAFGFGAQAYGPGYIEVRDGGVLDVVNGDEPGSASPLIGIRTDDIAAAVSAIVGPAGRSPERPIPFPVASDSTIREPGGVELLVYEPAE